MFKVLALILLGVFIIYCAFVVTSQTKKESKMTLLVSQAERSIVNAQQSVKAADMSFQEIHPKQPPKSKFE